MSPDFDGKGIAIIFGSLVIGIFLAAPPLWVGDRLPHRGDDIQQSEAILRALERDGGCYWDGGCGSTFELAKPWDAGPCGRPCDDFVDGGCVCWADFYRSCMAAHGPYDPETCAPFRPPPAAGSASPPRP